MAVIDISKLKVPKRSMFWKRTLSNMLKEHKIVDDSFTGKVLINMSQGGIGTITVEQIEHIK